MKIGSELKRTGRLLTRMLTKDEGLGHRPYDALETEVGKGATVSVLLTFSRSSEPGWKCILLRMHKASLTLLGIHQYPVSLGVQAALQ